MSTPKKLRKAKFAQSADHLIHLIDGINDQYTICGDAFEGGVEWDDNPNYSWITLSAKQAVTCPACARQIQQCRGVQVKA